MNRVAAEEREESPRALAQAAWLAVGLALLVLGLRVAAYLLTRSLAVLADAIEPLFNLLAAAVTVVGVLAGRRPADEDHPFGHRKLEFVVVGFHGAMVLFGAVIVAWAGLWQQQSSVPVRPTPLAVLLFAISIGLNAWLARRLYRVGAEHASPALRAAGRHARFDVLVGLGVLLNLCLVWVSGLAWIDAVVSVILIGAIAAGAIKLFQRAVTGLMDTASPVAVRTTQQVLDEALGEGIVGFHDIRCSDAGGWYYIDFHLQFAPGTSLVAAHDLAEDLEARVEQRLGSADVTSHLEPATEVRPDRQPERRAGSPRERARRRAAWLSLTVAIALVVIKGAASAATRSAAVLSDAMESLVNVAAAGFAVYSVRLSRRAADAEHPFGHYKIEFLAAALEGSLILLAALAIIGASIPRLLAPQLADQLTVGLLLLGLAGLANTALGLYLLRTGSALNSLTLEADGRHVLSDVATSVGVVGGLLLVKLTGWTILDPVLAILVACYILLTGCQLVRRSLAGVMDTVDPAILAQASRLLNGMVGERGIIGWHQLRIRDAGSHRFIDVHIQLADGADLAGAHRRAEEVEAGLEAELAPATAIVHAEPASEAR